MLTPCTSILGLLLKSLYQHVRAHYVHLDSIGPLEYPAPQSVFWCLRVSLPGMSPPHEQRRAATCIRGGLRGHGGNIVCPFPCMQA